MLGWLKVLVGDLGSIQHLFLGETENSHEHFPLMLQDDVNV